MATAPPIGESETIAALLAGLGDIDPTRIRFRPTPGTATGADLVALNVRRRGIFELVAGVLVAKPTGKLESLLAGSIIALLRAFVIPRNLGIITAPDALMRLGPDTYRVPAIAFIAWARIPAGPVTEESLAAVVPDLAIEVLSPSHTRSEMARKRREYFAAGVRLVWEVDPRTRTVAIYDPHGSPTLLDVTMNLDGANVLPGFRLPVANLFAELDRQRP